METIPRLLYPARINNIADNTPYLGLSSVYILAPFSTLLYPINTHAISLTLLLAAAHLFAIKTKSSVFGPSHEGLYLHCGQGTHDSDQ